MSAPAPGMPARAGGRKPGLREGIALGALAAVAIVAAAVLFRLTQPGDVGVPQTAAARAPAVASGPAPAAKVAAAAPTSVTAAPTPVAPADPALAGVTSVRLRIGPDFPPERKAAILAALAKAGITGVQVEALPFEIATSRVGYYRAADLAAAEALGRVVAPVIAAGGEVGVRDYGQLLADAEPGRLDLWVGG